VVCVADLLVNVTTDGPVAVVEMAAGKANALDSALCRQIAERFGELERGDARAVVLTGAGPMCSAPVLEQIDNQRATDEAVRAIWRSPAAQDSIKAYVHRVIGRGAP